MNDIEIFLSKRNHISKSDKVSVLEPYRDEIFQLKNMGYAEKIIVEFLLEMKGVKISRQALNQFIRSRSVQMQNTTLNSQEKEKTTATNTPPETNTNESQSDKTPKPQVKKGIKKFDWKNASTDGLI